MIGKRVLVWGMARSGIAAARLLNDAGAYVRINDIKTAEQIGEGLNILKTHGVEWRLGENIEDLFDEIDMLVISPGIPKAHPAVLKAEEKGIEVVGEVELAYRLGRGRVIAITGTNGKTTTTSLLGEIFKNAGKTTYVVGNIGDPYSEYAGKMKDDDMVVCEISSFQLETVSTFNPEVSLVLNISEDHLNRHGTMENYADIKTRVFQNAGEGQTVVLNYDDPVTRKMAEKVKGIVSWFSREIEVPQGAFVRNGIIVSAHCGKCEDVLPCEDVYIPGPHNLENALAATAAAIAAGIPIPVIRHTLRTFRGVEHRIETVRTLDGVKYINDSKGTNPDSTIKAVNTMRENTVIILGGSEKNSDYTELCREIVNSAVTYAVLIGKTGPAIGEKLKEAGFTAYEYAGYDFEAAILTARSRSLKGGNVLLSPACASFDMFSDYEARGREFKRIVNSLQENVG